jgi:hypothetical protein
MEILINVDIHISPLKSITMGIYYDFLYDNDVILPYKGKTECRYPAVLARIALAVLHSNILV